MREFHYVEIQFYIAYIFKERWNLLTKTWYFDQMYSRNIFTCLSLKLEISAHAQLMITRLYRILGNILVSYQLETYTKFIAW